MIARIQPNPLGGAVRAPGSREETHRALVCASLSGGESRVSNASRCEDTEATASCLRALGATVAGGMASAIGPLRGGEDVLLDCGDSEPTLRLLLPIALALGGSYRFAGSPWLFARQGVAQSKMLAQEGVAFVWREDGVNLSGRLAARPYRMDGAVSQHSVSGMLMALPLLGEGASLQLDALAASCANVQMTVRVMRRFGIEVREREGIFTANGVYRPCAHAVRGDWALASNWLAAGAVGGDVRVDGLDGSAHDGDAVISLLTQLGACVARREDRLRVSHAGVLAGQYDVTECPSYMSLLAVALSTAKGMSQLSLSPRMRGREAERLTATCAMLTSLGGIVRENAAGVTIRGVPLRGGEVDAAGDDRIAVAAAIAGTVATGPVAIRGVQCVTKSYPAFFEDMKKLGGLVALEEE